MKSLIALAAAAVIAVAATPALAKSKKKPRVQQGYYGEQYAYPGWASRNVSDPSLGYNYGLNRARATGRCVADLGYGRYEYCGW